MRDMDLSSCRVSRLHPTMHIEPKLKIWALFLQYFLVAEVRENRNQLVRVELHESKEYRQKIMKAIVSSSKYFSHPKPPDKNVFRDNCSRKYSTYLKYVPLNMYLTKSY